MQLSQQIFSEALTSLRLADLSNSGSDRRRHTRFIVQARLIAWRAASQEGESLSLLSRDISMDGVGLLWSSAIEAGKEFTLALPREKKTPYLVVCGVKHARLLAQGVWGVGAQFLHDLAHASGAGQSVNGAGIKKQGGVG